MVVSATTPAEVDAEQAGIMIETMDIARDRIMGTTTVTVGMLHPLIHRINKQTWLV